jgi:hypothetical protein
MDDNKATRDSQIVDAVIDSWKANGEGVSLDQARLIMAKYRQEIRAEALREAADRAVQHLGWTTNAYCFIAEELRSTILDGKQEGR